MEKMDHFSHIHPLLLKPQEYRNYHNQVPCSGCDKLLSGPVFCCVQCNYVLHKTCAEIPRHVKHPSHPQHPLILLSTSPYNGAYICNSCRGIFRNFVYHCFLCDYDLDVSCASQCNPDDGHKHEFMSTTNPQSFVCYACGMHANQGLACLCSICQIWVHSSCAELPLAIRIKGHDHPLKLTYTLHHVYGFWGNLTCDVCNGAMSPAFAGYFCETCQLPVHLKCPQQYLGEDWETVKDGEESLSDETEQSQDIDFAFSFFGDEHLLKFTEESESNDLQCSDKLCDACIQPIMPPFFSCKEENCGFFLHQSCAELPRILKQHPFHTHPLTLQSKAPNYDGIYRCDGCRRLSNGFVYRCDACQFDLDVCCGSLEERIEHESHMHPLLLKKTSVARQCKGCDLWSKHVFVCEVCEDFAIDCGCATLPSKAWHVYDKHPLSLNYFVGGGLREHECGICNEKMSPKQWFYYCDDCDSGAHPNCVVGKSRRVKFGGSFQYDVHSHPLALVEEAAEENTECKACGERCNGWTLECGQCKRYFHREGQCFWKEFKKSAKYLELPGMMRHRYAANVLASTPNVTTK